MEGLVGMLWKLHHHCKGWHLGQGQIVSDGDVGGSQIEGDS